MKKVLILAANPKGTSPLRLDEELREISEGLRRSQKRDEFSLEQKLAVRRRDIQRAMLDVKPQIVQFSGHGSEDEGLVFEDEVGQSKLVSSDALARLFKLFAEEIELECVVLNGCYSEVQARAIAQHINYVIGMSKAIGDRAAIEFAVGFYDALGAGESIEFAYKLGCSAIELEGIEEHLTPVLVRKSEIDDTGVVENIPFVESPSNVVLNMTGKEKEELYKQLDLELTVDERRELEEAIISAYRNKDELNMTFMYIFNEALNVYVAGENYKQIVFNLINWAESKGKLALLIVGLHDNNRGNKKLKNIKNKLMPNI